MREWALPEVEVLLPEVTVVLLEAAVLRGLAGREVGIVDALRGVLVVEWEIELGVKVVKSECDMLVGLGTVVVLVEVRRVVGSSWIFMRVGMPVGMVYVERRCG
jgi:hypothetical protein